VAVEAGREQELLQRVVHRRILADEDKRAEEQKGRQQDGGEDPKTTKTRHEFHSL
jgi:hypothetical protein